MESAKDQTSASATSAKSKLRYPLRSATKPREDKAAMGEISNPSASKRGRNVSNVSKSVSVLDLSGKEKSAKPIRRLSIPTKYAVNPLPKPVGNITPISETRMKKSANGQGKSDTPVSDVSKSANRRRFCALSSVSYWISQIKLSESAAKHSISLGFFKLALESGCEHLQRLQEELKSYVQRHNLLELGDPTKELLRSYNISEELERMQVSETCSAVPDSSDEDGNSSSTSRAGNLKPKSLNSENIRASAVAEKPNKESAQKRIAAVKNRSSVTRSSSNLSSVLNKKNNLNKSSQRTRMQEANKEKVKVKNSEKKLTSERDSKDALPVEVTQQDDKENVDAPELEEVSLTAEH